MIKAAFVLREHEQPTLAHKNARLIHRLVSMSGRAVRFEAIDSDLVGYVLIPTGLRPQSFVMAAVAIGLPPEQFITTRS